MSSGEKIGEFLIKIGAISEAQCKEILAEQGKKPNMLFGEIAIEKGYIDDSAISRYLESRNT